MDERPPSAVFSPGGGSAKNGAESAQFESELGARASIARLRHRAKRAARLTFEAQGYLEVDTPSLVVCPGLDAHVHSLGGIQVHGSTRYLTTSPEFHMKRLLAEGAERIYQFAHCFRAEELGTWHQPEFMMLEWYRAQASFTELLQQTEDLVRTIALELAPDGTMKRRDLGLEVDIRAPFVHLEVADAFRKFAGVDDVARLAAADPEEYFQVFVDRVEPALASFREGVLLKHYPISQAGLARARPEAPDFAERFELYVAGVELCNGFGELTDPLEQRRRFEAELLRRQVASEPAYPIDEDFLAALARGLPACVGNALGFDRLVSLCVGGDGLEVALPFPFRP